MSRSPSATERHEDLTQEELDRPAATSRIYQLSKKDGHVVVAFVLRITATVVIATATATLVRVPPTPGAIRTTDADLSIVRIDQSPSAVNLSAERHHEQ